MSVPTSKVLSVSRGFGMAAKFSENEAKQKVVVNVINDKKSVDAEEREVTNRGVKVEYKPNDVITSATDQYSNPYAGIDDDTPIEPRSLDTSDVTRKEINQLISNKDHYIEALSLMLDVIETNPLIINKYIIPEFNTLTRLVHLLTDADEIVISELDPDVSCTCSVGRYHYIDKIYVKRDGETKILKYEFPSVVQLFDKHRISLKTFYVEN